MFCDTLEAMPLFLTVIILGLIEGITEFLPISSTGHLIVAERILNFTDVKDIFTVVVQLGAIAAVLWFYRLDLIDKVRGLFAKRADALRFWKLIIIGTIPACVVGAAVGSSLDNLSKPSVVGWALIIGGVILWLADRQPVVQRNVKPVVEKISTKQALLVGLGQCLAIIPGVSRSGATIVSGLTLGIDRPTATALSFYLSLPVLFLASAYSLVKHPHAVSQLDGGPGILLLGIVAAFITALVSISLLLRYVSRHNFRPFAYYRIIVGILILLFVH
ncbi:MAG: undecaprenyl-diphosphatase [Candidatus Saccharibacteria bacterium]|nr:undecaprenyl-diphosphatase [Candidatus Saccharibacteria bacterium]